MVRKHSFALYILQNRRFRRSGELIEKTTRNVINLELKNKPWALQGLILELLDGFQKYYVFDEFVLGPKSTEHVQFAVR